VEAVIGISDQGGLGLACYFVQREVTDSVGENEDWRTFDCVISVYSEWISTMPTDSLLVLWLVLTLRPC